MIVLWRKLDWDEKAEEGDLWCPDGHHPSEMHMLRTYNEETGESDYVVYLHRLRPEDIGKPMSKLRRPHVCYWVYRAEGLIDIHERPVEPHNKERKITPDL